MRYQDQIITMTEGALKSFLAAARAMPLDKLEWKVENAGRSAMDQLQEVAQAILFAIPMLNDRKAGEWDPVGFEKLREERCTWTTIDKCEEVMWENFAKFKAVAEAFPEGDLEQKIWLPFGGGFETTMAEIMAYPYWNAVYHLGAVNFIQTLYGDWDMHHSS